MYESLCIIPFLVRSCCCTSAISWAAIWRLHSLRLDCLVILFCHHSVPDLNCFTCWPQIIQIFLCNLTLHVVCTHLCLLMCHEHGWLIGLFVHAPDASFMSCQCFKHCQALQVAIMLQSAHNVFDTHVDMCLQKLGWPPYACGGAVKRMILQSLVIPRVV